MVTCIDISSLYKGKRGKAILMVEQLASLRHKNLVDIYDYWMVPEQLIFIEMECPSSLTQWKTFTKRRMITSEVVETLQ